MPKTTIPTPKPPTITLTLTEWEVNSLTAWLDVTEPERCGGEPDDNDHDAEGHALDGSDHCMGYCPGDVDDLNRIAYKIASAARAAGW